MLRGAPLKLSSGPDPARQGQPKPAGPRAPDRLDTMRAANREARAARGRPNIACGRVDMDDSQRGKGGTAAVDQTQGDADADADADTADADSDGDVGYTRADYDASRKAIPQSDGLCCRPSCVKAVHPGSAYVLPQ